MASTSKVYDSAFKTIARKMPELMLPLVNEAFDRSYERDTVIARLSEEVALPNGSALSADVVLGIGGRIYHFECQSETDANMAVRMLEYDLAIAFAGKAAENGTPVVRFPQSCVVYLSPTSSSSQNLEVVIELPEGQRVAYRPRVLDASSYGAGDICSKELFALAPFYLVRYRRKLDRLQRDPDARGKAVSEYLQLLRTIRMRIVEADQGAMYNDLLEIAKTVNAHLLRNAGELGEEVEAAMGGEVWELASEKMERLEREVEQMGRENKRFERERDQARRECEQKDAKIEKLLGELRAHGIDENTIRGALA